MYKSVGIIIFLLHLKFRQNFKNYHARKLNKTDLVNMLCVTLKGCFLETNIQTRWYLYIHLEKDSTLCFCVSMKYLVVWILWPELQIYLQGVWFSDKFENNLRWSASFNFENHSPKFLQILILKLDF